jgi:hypothetical protein
VEITAALDTGAVAAAMERRCASKIKLRAEQLGRAGVKTISGWINSELGPGDGRSASRGMVSMRAIDWQFRVDAPGTLPVTSVIFATNITGPTKAKFWSLNSGHGAYTQTASGTKMTWVSTTEPWTGEEKFQATVNQPATTGHHWVERLPGFLRASANAMFI